MSETYIEALQDLSAEEIRTMVKVLECVHSNLSACKPLEPEPLDRLGSELTAREG
jgi:hypothetical protein